MKEEFNNLMIFENKNVEVFEFKGQVLFNPYDVGRCLELTNSAVRKAMQSMNDLHKLKIKYSDAHNVNNLVIPTSGRVFLTKSGVLLLIQNCNKISSEEKNTLIKKITGADTIVVKSRFEAEFKENLTSFCNALNIEVEYQKSVLNYKIDFYLPQYNLAIEYDEEHHKNRFDKDLLREVNINNVIGCNFLRINYKNSDSYNLGLLIKKLKLITKDYKKVA